MTAETPQGSAGQLSGRHEVPRTQARDKFIHQALGSETPSKADVFFVMPIASGAPVAARRVNRTLAHKVCSRMAQRGIPF
jgi:hypothetical protein